MFLQCLFILFRTNRTIIRIKPIYSLFGVAHPVASSHPCMCTVPMALGDRAIFVIKISRPTCNDRLSVDIIVVAYHM